MKAALFAAATFALPSAAPLECRMRNHLRRRHEGAGILAWSELIPLIAAPTAAAVLVVAEVAAAGAAARAALAGARPVRDTAREIDVVNIERRGRRGGISHGRADQEIALYPGYRAAGR